MKTIDLRSHYPGCPEHAQVEVSDEVAAQLRRFHLDEEAARLRTLRAKAYYSLDCGDGIEQDMICQAGLPESLLLRAELRQRLQEALSQLSEVQRRRVVACVLGGASKAAVARSEGVDESTVRESVRSALSALRRALGADGEKFLEDF